MFFIFFFRESSSGQPIRPQPPLPPISGTEATRGHPIEEFPDKNRLTPLGKEAEFQFEDTPRKKKKKKKSERKDTEDEN